VRSYNIVIMSETTYAIETRGLRKVYGDHVAVDGLDMHVPRGGVHGFLGPNGAGKTTTIRLLLGLTEPTAGTMDILGRAVPEALPEAIAHVGAIVESPKFFGGFSARLNLELCADAVGLPHSAVDRVLEETGLTARANDKFKTFSLGMKQRMAVAGALLKDPEILIFDEPTNGLDPGGIVEIREAIRDLGEAGRTVLVSSHILSEIEQMCDTVTIVAKGRVLAEGKVTDFTGSVMHILDIGMRDLPSGQEVLRQAGLTVHRGGDHLVVEGYEEPEQVVYYLAQQGLYPNHVVARRPDLESIFLDLTDGIGQVGEMAINTPGVASGDQARRSAAQAKAANAGASAKRGPGAPPRPARGASADTPPSTTAQRSAGASPRGER
jgi:ABC-2 type transport system ATP-binding protein